MCLRKLKTRKESELSTFQIHEEDAQRVEMLQAVASLEKRTEERGPGELSNRT